MTSSQSGLPAADLDPNLEYPELPAMDGRDFPGNDPQTWSLFIEYHRTPDRRLRNELIECHLQLADGLARRYVRRGEPFDDLRQVALVGLLKAVERFDPRRGLPFGSFAVPTIRGELRRHFRDRGWTIRVPRRVQELHLELDGIVSRTSHALGRAPTIAEMAEAAGVSEEAVLEAIEAVDMYRPRSIDAMTDTASDSSAPAADRLGAEDPELASAADRVTVAALMECLPERQRRIVHMRFFEDMTQTEIAGALEISQMHVSRLLTRSMEQLAALGLTMGLEREAGLH